MNLLGTLSTLEENENLHLGRLLILLRAFVGENGDGTLEGLTKLAKLDFLLRYPIYLEQALLVKNASTKGLNILSHERKSVESGMVRYRYGPWDFRYRKWINILIAKGLANVRVDGKTIHIGLTDSGINKANSLIEEKAFMDMSLRATILKRHFDYKGTTLMKFVYKTFPEIASLKLGEEI
jgi:hypothetical protein